MKYVFPLLCIFLISLSVPQPNRQYTESVSIFDHTFKRDSVIKDLSILYDLLNGIHPGQQLHCTKPAFDNCYDSLVKSITADISPFEYYSKAVFLISKIKDGHTSIDNSIIKKQFSNRPVFPFSIYKTAGGFCINCSGAKAYDNFIGTSILTINGKGIDEIAGKVEKWMSIEGTNETAVNFSLRDFPFYYAMMDTSTLFTIEYSDNGKTNTAVLRGIEYKAYLQNTRKTVPPADQAFKDNHIGILTVNTFNAGDFEYYGINYKKYFDAFFREVAKRKITNLVIDVRGNSGGSAEVSNYLFSCLTNKPYYYFEYVGKKYSTAEKWKMYCTTPQYLVNPDSAHTKYHNNLYCETETGKKDYWWFEQQQGKKKCYTGNLITLIDGGCFSTTGHFAALLKQNNIGKLYGECTQGSYYSNDGTLVFQLPYSGFLIRIPTAQFKMRMPGFPYDPKGICPDVEIAKRPQDFKLQYDRQLSFACEQFGK